MIKRFISCLIVVSNLSAQLPPLPYAQPTTVVVQKWFGVTAPSTSPFGAAYLPGDLYFNTATNPVGIYICGAPQGTPAPACTSVGTGQWTPIVSSSGSIVTSGSIIAGFGSSIAGALSLGQGIQPSLGTNAISIFAPTSIPVSFGLALSGSLPMAGQVPEFGSPTLGVYPVIWANVGTQSHTISITIDGQGSVLGTGVLYIGQAGNFSCNINGWSLVGSPSGSISIELDALANSSPPAAPLTPTSLNKISASAPMAISSGLTASGGASAVSTWSVTRAPFDTFGVNVASVASITKIQVTVFCQ